MATVAKYKRLRVMFGADGVKLEAGEIVTLASEPLEEGFFEKIEGSETEVAEEPAAAVAEKVTSWDKAKA